MRGYFGIALFRPKNPVNVASVLRNADAFGASFVSLIAPRYPERELIRHAANTSKAERHMPVTTYESLEAFVASRPFACPIVRVEVDGRDGLPTFNHPLSAVYLFGPEDGSIPVMPGERSVSIDTSICLNLAMTTGIVMYDRAAKAAVRKAIAA